MSRKIGFETPKSDAKKSIADDYLDTFRQKQSRGAAGAVTSMKVTRNWGTIVFLTIWLTGWTFAIFAAVGIMIFGAFDLFVFLFLLVWSTVAVVFWVLAFRSFRTELRGRPRDEIGPTR